MEIVVEGQFETRDYWQSLSRGKPALIYYGFLTVFGLVGGTLLTSLWKSELSLPARMGWTILFGLGFAGIGIFSTWRSFRKNPDMTAYRHFIINEEGIRQEESRGYIYWEWSQVSGMEETKDYLYVKGKKERMMIPKRFFADATEARKAAEYITSKVPQQGK